MGKTFADPLFIALIVAVGAQFLLYRSWRGLGRSARVGVLLLGGATIGLWLLGTHATESFLVHRLNQIYEIPTAEAISQIDVVIVLSGGFVDAPGRYAQPDGWTTARVSQGVRTFFDSGARQLVVSGRWEMGARLAEAMKQLAIDLGVPPEQIVVEPNAKTTREHPTELLQLHIVSPDDTLGVVTSSWHLPRAMTEFQKHFQHLVAVPAFDTAIKQKSGLLRWLPRSASLASSAMALAEYIGAVWYRLLS